MATAIRTIGHEDRLSLVEHLEELRTRLIVSGVVLAVVFGVCLWQNHALLHLINRPLERADAGAGREGRGPAGQTVLAQQAVIKVAGTPRRSRGSSARPTATCRRRPARSWPRRSRRLRADMAKIPPLPQGEKLMTLGIGEPFTDDAHGHLLLRAGLLAAGDPVRAVRLRAARAAAE